MTKTKSPFSQQAKELYQAGYSVVPLCPKSKAPLQEDWSVYSRKRMPASLVKEFMTESNLNIGVALGPASNIIALDFDYDTDGLHAQIEEMIPDSPVKKFGNKGYTAFYKYNGEANRSWSTKIDGKKETVIDLCSTGRQVAVPPSIHPNTGKPFTYTTELGLSDIDPEDLPELPKDFSEQLDKLFGRDKKHDRLDIGIEDLEEALNYIDPDEYEIWIRVGMAIKSEYPDDEGFELWDTWSSESDKYNPDEMPQKWKSFRSEGVSGATVIYLAQQEGFECRFTNDQLKQEVLRHFITLDQVEDQVDSWKDRGKDHGYKCGVEGVDELISFRPGEFTVVSGYGNAGKSELLDSIVMGLASGGWCGAIASMEKSHPAHYDNLIQKRTQKPRNDTSAQEYREAKAFVRDKIVLLDYNSVKCDIDGIIEQCRRYKRFNPLHFIVIDPYNYVRSAYGYTQPLAHLNYVLTNLSNFAKQENLHVFLVAHPTKPDRTFGELPKITKYSIAGGADFVNIVDNIILVHRGEGNTITVETDKVREQEVDVIGEVDLCFDKDSKSYFAIDPYLEKGDY